jgi:hypothetical protein
LGAKARIGSRTPGGTFLSAIGCMRGTEFKSIEGNWVHASRLEGVRPMQLYSVYGLALPVERVVAFRTWGYLL